VHVNLVLGPATGAGAVVVAIVTKLILLVINWIDVIKIKKKLRLTNNRVKEESNEQST
jgi:hypothetical protein